MSSMVGKASRRVGSERSCVSVANGPFIDGRTTGIEPARGGFTIHCLDPLGYIRPYPQVLVSIYDQILYEPPMTAIKEKLFPRL